VASTHDLEILPKSQRPEAYKPCGVLFASVATHDLADQTPALLYPVVVSHLNSHAHACILRFMTGVHSLGAGLEAVFSRMDKEDQSRKGSGCTKY
jgi:hypothetical protein